MMTSFRIFINSHIPKNISKPQLIYNPLSNFHYFNLSKLRGNGYHTLVSVSNEKVYCKNISTKIIRSYFFSTDFTYSLDFIQNNKIPKFQNKRNILPYLFCKCTTLTFQNGHQSKYSFERDKKS